MAKYRLIVATLFVALWPSCKGTSLQLATAQDLDKQQSSTTTHEVIQSANTRCPSSSGIVAILGRGSTLMAQGQFKDAAALLGPLSALGCDPRSSLLLAAASEASGDPRTAEMTLERAHTLWPADNSVGTSLARIYLKSGRADKAVLAIKNFHADETTPWQELELASVVFIAGGDLRSAQAAAQQAYRLYPSLDSLLLMSNALQLEGRYKDVIALLEDKRELYSKQAAFFVTLAESEYDADIYDAARTDLERAIHLNPMLGQAHYLLGNVLLKSGSAEQASTEYREAIELAPDQPRSYYQLALSLRAEQDEAGEEDALTKALAINGHYALAQAEMGRIRLNQNRLPEAIDHLSAAVRDNPTAEQPYYLLAKAYDRLGETEKSVAMAKHLASIRKENHRGTKNLDFDQNLPSEVKGP